MSFNPFDDYFYYGYRTYITKINYIENTKMIFDYYNDEIKSFG